MASVERRDEASLIRLSVELERLAGELGRLGAESPLPAPPKCEHDKPADRLRQRLHHARKARGLRQVDLAERLDRPQSFVSNYERGDRRLEVVEFIQIAKALGVDPAAVVAEIAADMPA